MKWQSVTSQKRTLIQVYTLRTSKTNGEKNHCTIKFAPIPIIDLKYLFQMKFEVLFYKVFQGVAPMRINQWPMTTFLNNSFRQWILVPFKGQYFFKFTVPSIALQMRNVRTTMYAYSMKTLRFSMPCIGHICVCAIFCKLYFCNHSIMQIAVSKGKKRTRRLFIFLMTTGMIGLAYCFIHCCVAVV